MAVITQCISSLHMCSESDAESGKLYLNLEHITEKEKSSPDQMRWIISERPVLSLLTLLLVTIKFAWPRDDSGCRTSSLFGKRLSCFKYRLI